MEIKGQCLIEIRDAKTGRLKSRDVVRNMFVTSGKASVAKLLTGSVENNTGQITHCAVGTNASTPNLSDVGLEAELYRKQVSIRDSVGNVSIYQTFFNQNEANGVLREAGLFGDLATATPGTGTLFARLNINHTKTINDTLKFTWMIGVGEYAAWSSPGIEWSSMATAWNA